MIRRCLVIGIAAMVVLFVAVPFARAGGWAVVTLDSLPHEVRAGQSLTLGFMVRQHGHTPNDQVAPYLAAHNSATGDTLKVDARKEGPTGHFVVDVTFPRAGTWEWSITPEPFGETRFAPLTVLPASAPAPSAATTFAPVALLQPSAWRIAGLGLLVVAAVLALLARRAQVARQLAPRVR